MIDKTPIYIELDRRREVVFNLNTEILIRSACASEDSTSLCSTVGERVNPKTGEPERVLDVNLNNLRVYLWAALQQDARARDEKLTIEDVGQLITQRRFVTRALLALTQALKVYYGDAPGEV